MEKFSVKWMTTFENRVHFVEQASEIDWNSVLGTKLSLKQWKTRSQKSEQGATVLLPLGDSSLFLKNGATKGKWDGTVCCWISV
jgi:hypothetical protein